MAQANIAAALVKPGTALGSQADEVNRHRECHQSVLGRHQDKDLKTHADGSLTICVRAEERSDAALRVTWLPAPTGDVSLHIRAYWPEAASIRQ